MKDISHIPNAEIEQDIADTEHEIAVMQKEIAALELMPRDKMASFRASARRHGVKERQEFIAKLRAILASRGLGTER